MLHSSTASGHRGVNGHPGGRFVTDGGAPDLLRKLDAPTRTRVVARAHALGMLPGADG